MRRCKMCGGTAPCPSDQEQIVELARWVAEANGNHRNLNYEPVPADYRVACRLLERFHFSRRDGRRGLTFPR